MEYFAYLLQSLIADKQTVRLLFIICIVLATCVFALGIALIVLAIFDPVKKRFKKLLRDGSSEEGAASELDSKLVSVSQMLLPKSDREKTETKTRLMLAGFTSSQALIAFYGIRISLFVVLPALVLVIAPIFPQIKPQQVLIFFGIAAFLAILIPGMALDRLITKRKRKLRNAFPDALDMLVVCVEAGMGLNAALKRVATDLDVSHPELATEIDLVTIEVRAGIDLIQSLKNMVLRTGLDDISGMVSLLAQSTRFGTSIADTLRVYSEEFRDKRVQLAEEEAAKIGTKMIFPMVLCLFPAFFVVAIGPAVLSVLKVFK